MDDKVIEKQMLDSIEQSTKIFLKMLREQYMHQEIAEYTRLRDALETFLKFGFWSRHVEDEEPKRG